MKLVLFLLPLLLFEVAIAVPELKQVHVITRHGSRTPLPKGDNTLLELAGSTLTPLGQKQLYDVGTWLRQVYNTNKFLEYYDPAEVRLESSDLERTLTSANSLSLGLFPYNAQAGNYGQVLYESLLPEMPGLPVYSMRESNDIYFRAYYSGNCPVFLKRLDELYTSERWTQIENGNQEILTKLATLFPEDFEDGDNNEDNDRIRNGAVVMKYLWDYYDKIKVARTECLPDPTVYACTAMGTDISKLSDALTDTEFEEVEQLMGTTEAIKFGIGQAGNLLGSQLLWRMINRVTNAQGKFFLYSAHAPTMMGLLSTLQEWVRDEVYPDYGSAIIMEVYQETDESKEYSIRFLYKASSHSAAVYVPLTQPNCEVPFTGETPAATAESTTEKSHCLLADFIVWATEKTLMRPEDWCEACDNESADVCLQAIFNQSPIKLAFQDLASEFESDPDKALIIAGTFFGGFFAGLIIMGAGCSLCQKAAAKDRKDRMLAESNGETREQHPPTEVEVETIPAAANAEIN